MYSSRSGGQPKVTVCFAESPLVADDGATEAIFLVRGVSYAVHQYDSEAAAESLRAGDRLTLVDDPTNEANPRALLRNPLKALPWVGSGPPGPVRTCKFGNGGGFVELLQNNGPARAMARPTPGTDVRHCDPRDGDVHRRRVAAPD